MTVYGGINGRNYISKDAVVTIVSNERDFGNTITLIWGEEVE